MRNSHDTHSTASAAASSAALREKFVQLAQSASDTSDPELAIAASVMADLLTVAALFEGDSEFSERADEIVEFCSSRALPTLLDSESDDARDSLLAHVENHWSECLNLLEPDERIACQLERNWDSADTTNWNESVTANVSVDSARERGADSADVTSKDDSEPSMDLAAILASLEGDAAIRRTAKNDLPAVETSDDRETIDDPEMIAAYTDDAQQCLAEMESSLLALESGDAAEESLRNFRRQLHTLKGASGTVGLSQLAGYLHDLESYAEKSTGGDVDVDRLLQGVDVVRAQLAALGISGDTTPTLTANEVPVLSSNPLASVAADFVKSRERQGASRRSSPEFFNESPAASALPLTKSTAPSSVGNESEIFVRIEASRLERLMDLLAELVMLRNRRDTYAQSLKTIHRELNHCASRSRALTSAFEASTSAATPGNQASITDAERASSRSRLLSLTQDEVSKDTAELARSLQEVCDPLAADNSVVSHLIGRFRQELMELRRLPIGGLFQRLQRVIRDAAKSEGKLVEIVFEGQGARAERAVQERLFEPLLHLVRNAVSHGIDTPDERNKIGKSAAGRITLAAWSDATSLCIEVRDDGRGMNDEVLESRGRELGLLPQGQAVSRSQLWNLIFQPGFSTKAAVSEISGRGVGMDVVNNWVRRLRGRIDVESVSGQGTTFRIQIPLRSAVEHAMVVQAGGQLFALPMHTIGGTSDAKLRMNGLSTSMAEVRAIPLSQILGRGENASGRGCHIALRDSVRTTQTAKSSPVGDVTIVVDTIVGVEEIVVRSLPPLLQRNEFFAGVTLSGRAETVLLLDVSKVIERGRRMIYDEPDASQRNEFSHDRSSPAHCQNSVLVVDDSVVVRRRLSKKLTAAGHTVREAANGREAMAVLNVGGITAVITDLDMPGMTGVELMQEMKRQKPYRTIPVTVLSSRDEDSMPPEVGELRPDAILQKPVTDQTVNSIVDWLALCQTRNEMYPNS